MAISWSSVVPFSVYENGKKWHFLNQVITIFEPLGVEIHTVPQNDGQSVYYLQPKRILGTSNNLVSRAIYLQFNFTNKTVLQRRRVDGSFCTRLYLNSSNIRLLLFFRFILGWSLAFWEWLWCCYWWPLWSWCVETSRRSLTSIPWCLRAPCQIVTWWEISLPLLVMGPLSPPNCMTNQSTKRALPYITNPIGKSSISCLFTILHNVVLFFNKVGFATK